MRHPWTLGIVFGLILAVPFAGADVLITSEGNVLQGTFQNFSEGKFRFEIGGEVREFSPEQVTRLDVDRSPTNEELIANTQATFNQVNQMNQNLQVVNQRLANLEQGMANLNAFQQQHAAQISQRVYELNPVARLSVERQTGERLRGGGFRVSGYLRNGSGEQIWYPKVRIDLITQAGTVVASETVQVLGTVINTGQAIRFEHSFPPIQGFDTYRITPVIDFGSNRRQTP